MSVALSLIVMSLYTSTVSAFTRVFSTILPPRDILLPSSIEA
ncbi:MAG: hypothetical protein RBS89_03285 [Candidatus Delongbacteria bacterium]|nr:hypothetical protein [Candidatus Delongbacteria bacterium]